MNAHRLPSLFTRTIATSLVSLGLATGLAHGDGPTSNPTIWVANGRDATVSVIDRVDGDVVGRVAVGAGPTKPVPSPDGTSVYVAITDDDSISIVDTRSWTVIETVTCVPEPHDAAISADGTRLLIAAAGSNEVLVLDTETRAIVDRFAVGNEVRGLILDRDDAVAYATNKANGTVSRIDLASGEVQTFAVGAGPHGLRLAPDGSRLYVARSGANAVGYVEPESSAVERTVPVGASPEQLDISPDGAWLAVANVADETVTHVDVERAAAVRSSATGPGTHGIAPSNAPLGAQSP